MKTVQTLISIAREKVHTDRELADRAGISPVVLAELKSGKRPMSIENAAALCDVAGVHGEEARKWVAVAAVENPKNAAKAAMLKRVLFGLGAASVALLLQVPNDAQARTAAESPALAERGDGLYIMSTYQATPGLAARIPRLSE